MEILKEDSKIVELYDNDKERRLHLNAVEMLAMDMGISAEEVERLYTIVLERFKRGATVKDFLPILVSRRAKYLLDVRRNKKGDGGQ